MTTADTPADAEPVDEAPDQPVDEQQSTPRLIVKHPDKRVTGSVYHSYPDCGRIVPALAEKGTELLDVNDQTIDLLGLSLCAECVRRAESDPSASIRRAVDLAVTDADTDPLPVDVPLFLEALDKDGFEVRRKRKPREKK